MAQQVGRCRPGGIAPLVIVAGSEGCSEGLLFGRKLFERRALYQICPLGSARRTQFVTEFVQPFRDLLFQERFWQPERLVGYGHSGLADLERECPRYPVTGEFAVNAMFAELVIPLHAMTQE